MNQYSPALRCFCSFLFLAFVSGSCNNTSTEATQPEAGKVAMWLTTGDKTSLLEKQTTLTFSDQASSSAIIELDTTQRYQTIDGFGYALTGGSAYLISDKLTVPERDTLLQELFSTDEHGIGISYLRVSIGASDLDDHVFSYCDLPTGKTDPELKNFTLKEDREHLIPVLKQILAISPDIKIMGSPWSAPAWMKTNKLPKGGSLKEMYYESYAQYFVKYIQEMAKEGINIDAITLQNEPENPHNTPSMLMTAAQQAKFVRENLGPAFARNGIKTKIVVFDHNCDHPEYPIGILNDHDARKYIDGSAFHLYLGDIGAMSEVHDAHPDKNLYFTEQWTSGEGKFDADLRWHVKNLIVGATRNWSRNVLEWNLAADPHFDPHTDDGGCTQCMGALTIGDSISRNVSYYIIAHASKFVSPGAVRIGSNIVDGLHNVAFLNPNGDKVVIVVNDNDSSRDFVISHKKSFVSTLLPGGAVASYIIR